MAITLPPSPTADAYIDAAGATTYFADRLSVAAWTAATTDEKERALKTATRYLDGEEWAGEKADDMATNALRWPRRGVLSPDGESLSEAAVPPAIGYATAELALILLETAAAGSAAASYPLQKLEVGTIKLTYDTGEVVVSTGFKTRYADLTATFLAPYLRPGRFSASVGLIRA